MPNHVTTMMRVAPEVAKAIVRTPTEEERLAHEASEQERRAMFAARGREDQFAYHPIDMERMDVDFAMVIPEPEDLFRGGCDMQHPHLHEDGTPYAACWYEWNVNNWGTKWNAYETEIDASAGDLVVIRFDSAWSHPLPVVIALSKMFPEETLDVMFADEDLGSNCGAYSITNGAIESHTTFEQGSDEANEFAAQIKYGKSYRDLMREWGEEDEDDQMPELLAEQTEATS